MPRELKQKKIPSITCPYCENASLKLVSSVPYESPAATIESKDKILGAKVRN